MDSEGVALGYDGGSLSGCPMPAQSKLAHPSLHLHFGLRVGKHLAILQGFLTERDAFQNSDPRLQSLEALNIYKINGGQAMLSD